MRLGLPALLLGLSLAYLLLGAKRPLNMYDEGLIAVGAERVLNGQMPYRDFWTIYSPGQFYVLASLFQLLGRTIPVLRGWDMVTRALLALGLYALARRMARPLLALAAWAMATLWLGFYWFYGYPTFQSLALCLLSIILALRAIERERSPSARTWLFASGAAAGLASLFRHDFGVYALVAGLLAFAVRPGGLSEWPSSSAGHRRCTPGLAWAKGWPYLFGFLAAAAPLWLLIASAVSLPELFYSLVVFPATVFPRFRQLPYPDLSPANLVYFLPLAICLLAFVVALWQILRRRNTGTSSWGMLGLALFAMLTFNQARVRADLIHQVQVLLPSLVLLVSLLALGWRARRLRVPWLILGLLAVAAILVQPAAEGLDRVRQALHPPTEALGLARSSGIPIAPSQHAAVEALRSLVPEGQPIYVGAGRHDRLFVNDVMFYFLAARPPATRYHELHPGVATTRDVQMEIVSDLRQGVRFIVLFTGWDSVTEPNEGGRSSGVDLLDRAIREEYVLWRQIGDYQIWQSRR